MFNFVAIAPVGIFAERVPSPAIDILPPPLTTAVAVFVAIAPVAIEVFRLPPGAKLILPPPLTHPSFVVEATGITDEIVQSPFTDVVLYLV